MLRRVQLLIPPGREDPLFAEAMGVDGNSAPGHLSGQLKCTGDGG